MTRLCGFLRVGLSSEFHDHLMISVEATLHNHDVHTVSRIDRNVKP